MCWEDITPLTDDFEESAVKQFGFEENPNGSECVEKKLPCSSLASKKIPMDPSALKRNWRAAVWLRRKSQWIRKEITMQQMTLKKNPNASGRDYHATDDFEENPNGSECIEKRLPCNRCHWTDWLRKNTLERSLQRYRLRRKKMPMNPSAFRVRWEEITMRRMTFKKNSNESECVMTWKEIYVERPL